MGGEVEEGDDDDADDDDGVWIDIVVHRPEVQSRISLNLGL
jgi:hypothetical protein